MMSADPGAARAPACWLDRTGFSLRPTTVGSALAALDEVAAHLSQGGDRRAAFPAVYAMITLRVAERAEWGPRRFFREPAWISRLAARFCERYLQTLRWSLLGHEQDCGAWTAAYAARERAGVTPLQHAFLGLSAHINFDLAIGIARTLADHGCASDPARLARCKHDHDVVNELLRVSFPEALQRLASRHACAASGVLLERARRPAEWVTMAILGTWRDHVWGDALALLEAPTASARDRIVSRMEGRSRRIGRAIGSLAVPGWIA